jgi:hypothetical protein
MRTPCGNEGYFIRPGRVTSCRGSAFQTLVR